MVTWFAFSQCLNVGVYRAIGQVGVYNGIKVLNTKLSHKNNSILKFVNTRFEIFDFCVIQMGHHIPWVHGYPFSLEMRHPQYTGKFQKEFL